MKYNSCESSIKSCSETNVYIRMLESWDHVDIIWQMSWILTCIHRRKKFFFEELWNCMSEKDHIKFPTHKLRHEIFAWYDMQGF